MAIKTNTTYLTYLARFDSAVAYTNRTASMNFQQYWMPDKSAWIGVGADNAVLFRQFGAERRDLWATLRPGFPIGFATNSLFLCATDQPPPYATRVSVEYWDLSGEPKRTSVKQASFGGNMVYSASTSPSGDRILWQCIGTGWAPRVSACRKFPFIDVRRKAYTSYYLSSEDIRGSVFLGSIAIVDGNFPVMQWLPSGKALSYVDHGAVNIIDLTSLSR